MKGLNIQGCVRSQIHPKGTSYTKMIDNCANVIKDLNVDSIRIGGTPMEGAIFDEDVPGYGSPHTNFKDQYNYPIAFLDVCQAAGIDSVLISLHCMTDPNKLTFSDVETIIKLCTQRNITKITFGLDNEPYSPKRMSDDNTDFEFMRDLNTYLNSRGIKSVWPVIHASTEETPNRKRRRDAYLSRMLTQDALSHPNNTFEVHLYCPVTTDPMAFLKDTLSETSKVMGSLGAQREGSEIIIGEWSGKNQETFADEEIENLLSVYLDVLKSRRLSHYYQLLGGMFDQQGLFNFQTGKPNRGYDIFRDA
jgi:hypothetical protein